MESNALVRLGEIFLRDICLIVKNNILDRITKPVEIRKEWVMVINFLQDSHVSEPKCYPLIDLTKVEYSTYS